MRTPSNALREASGDEIECGSRLRDARHAFDLVPQFAPWLPCPPTQLRPFQSVPPIPKPWAQTCHIAGSQRAAAGMRGYEASRAPLSRDPEECAEVQGWA